MQEHLAPTIFASEGLPGKEFQLLFSDMFQELTLSSPNSGFVDKSGVALTSGGGTLVLGTHDSVSKILFSKC